MDRTLTRSRIRPFTADDAESVARHIGERAVWRNLRDRVPHPYTVEDARQFLSRIDAGLLEAFAIEVDGAAVGAVGGWYGDDVRRRTFEVGFWLGTAYHGRGIMSEVVPAYVEWVLAHHDVGRVEAQVFGWNEASERVLAKAGFVKEATLRDAITKDGATTDLTIWAIVPGARG